MKRINIFNSRLLSIKGGTCLILTIIFIIPISCSFRLILIKDQVEMYKNSIVIASSKGKDIKYVQFLDPVNPGNVQKISFLDQFKPLKIKSCKYINETTRILISEMKGFFIIFLKDKNPQIINIPCTNDNFVNCAIGDVFFFEREREVAVVYDTGKGEGVTRCFFDENWNLVNCKTLDKDNSGLLTNDVVQVIKDEKKNVWFRYARYLKKGVTRISPDGNWDHYDHKNSKLGHSSVSKIVIEEKGRGFEGDNLWFITDNGLTSLKYVDEKELWTLYGKKRDSTDSFLRALGMQYISKKGVVDINGLVFVNDKIFLSNKIGLFQFDGKNIKRYIPHGLGGHNEKEILSMIYRNNKIILIVVSDRKQDREVTDIKIFNLKTKKWESINLWDYNKSFPFELHISPVNEKFDFISLNYLLDKPVFLLLNYEDDSLMKMKSELLK